MTAAQVGFALGFLVLIGVIAVWGVAGLVKDMRTADRRARRGERP